MDTLSPAALAAARDYDLYRCSLEADAKAARASQRPLRARRLEHNARIVKRARLAELLDPQPTGIGTFE